MELSEIASASALLKAELAPLAEKLGQGAEYTFEIFRRQVLVVGIVQTILLILFLSFSIFMGHISWQYNKDKGDGDVIVFTFLLSLFSGVGFFCLIGPVLTAFINSDYLAIKLIMETFIK